MTGISFYCFLWRLISVRRVRASNGRQNRFLYRSHRNEQSRKNIVFMRLCGVSGILFSRRGEQIILLFFITAFLYSYFSVYHYHKVHTSKDSTKYYHNILIYHPTNHLLPLEQINLWIYIVKYLLNLFSPVELLQDYNSYCFLKSESAFLASPTCPLLIASSASANFFSIS